MLDPENGLIRMRLRLSPVKQRQMVVDPSHPSGAASRPVVPPRLNGASTLAAILCSAAASIGIVFALTGFPFTSDYSRAQSFGIWPDVLHERAIAVESLSGDPHRPITDIMADYGYPAMVGGPSPRTPAAVLFQLPLLLISQSALMPAVTWSIVGLVIASLWLTANISEVSWRRLAWLVPLLLISYPVVTSISYGSMTVMVTVALVLLAWAFRDRPWSSVPLGLAAAIRLWPMLIIVGFWISGRRRAAYVALAVLVSANLLGLLLPGVTLEGSVAALVHGGAAWVQHPQNASAAVLFEVFGMPAIAATVAVSLIAVVLALRNPAQAIPICLVAALVASPLSWPTYMLTALPLLIIWWRTGGRIPVAVLAAPLLLWMYTPTGSKGYIDLAVLVALLAYASFTTGLWKDELCTAT